MLSVKVLTLAILAALGVANAQQQCRCQASFEHFYNDRRRHLGRYPYDYRRSYVDVDGNYIVNGIRVLPNSDPACSGTRANNRIWRYIFGNHNRRLSEVDENWTTDDTLDDMEFDDDFIFDSMFEDFLYEEEEEGDFEKELKLEELEEEDEAGLGVERNLRRRYYYFGKGKGKGKGRSMGMGMVRFLSCSLSSLTFVCRVIRKATREKTTIMEKVKGREVEWE